MVYQVENGKITEYWVQTDRLGLEEQLKHNQQAAAVKTGGKAPYTAAVAANGLLYVSGQIGTDAGGNLVNTSFEVEAQQVMQNLGNVLQTHGLAYNNLVNVTIYLTSMQQYAAINEVYSRYFTGAFPARVCIAVQELPKQARVEIAAVAALQAVK
ncbi:RidA family protein [Deminuibacter soli]|uniref:RidA family protein n=2 Tax=Deminuibacter soli TaxID=2291815 RepID=A0A3E1NK84_9BACT|nr:RidA family protein [Deminuibacter soli]